MCYPGSNSSVPLCADSFAGWCLAPFYSIAQEWSVFRDKFCTVTQRQPFCSVLCFTLKLYYTSRKQRFCQNFWIPPLKNCLQSGSFWVSQSHFFKGDRKVIALAAFEMRGCQSSRPRTSVGNTFRFFAGNHTDLDKIQYVRGRNSGAFSNESGASLSKKDFSLFTQNPCSRWHLPFAAFQSPFTGALTNAHTHTHIPVPFLPIHIQTSPALLSPFFPVSALQTFHWMFYRVARNTKHAEKGGGACHGSPIHLNATWQRFTLRQRQEVTLEECLFFPQLIDCECPSLRSINHVSLDSAAFILCSA